MSAELDYYAVLSVPPTVSPQELKRQYRRLVKICHPDRNPGEEEWCTRQLRAVNEAYEVLSDPVRRARYDRELDLARSAVSQAAKAKTSGVDRNIPPMPDIPIDFASINRVRLRPRPGRTFVPAIAAGAAIVVMWLAFLVSLPRPPAMAPLIVSSPVRGVVMPPRSAHPNRARIVRRVEVLDRARVWHTAHRSHRPELTPAEKDARALAIAERVEAAKRAAHHDDL